jgi:hypothetical protein
MVKFRETIWFKRGELVEVETEEEPVELPIEDRYLDTGGVTHTDSVLFGVHSGETSPIPMDPAFAVATIACDPQMAPDLQALVRELKQRNRTIFAVVGAAMVACVVLVVGVL